MDAREFKATLQMLVPMVVSAISQRSGLSDDEVIPRLYASRLYADLERENEAVAFEPLRIGRLVGRRAAHGSDTLSGGGVMSIENEFLVYGMEEYKNAHAMTGAAVAALFSKFGVFDYVRRHYDALHTTGGAYLVGDIDAYLKARGGDR